VFSAALHNNMGLGSCVLVLLRFGRALYYCMK
jgi:hypothetical protein